MPKNQKKSDVAGKTGNNSRKLQCDSEIVSPLPDPPYPFVIKRDHLAMPLPQMIMRYLNKICESK